MFQTRVWKSKNLRTITNQVFEQLTADEKAEGIEFKVTQIEDRFYCECPYCETELSLGHVKQGTSNFRRHTAQASHKLLKAKFFNNNHHQKDFQEVWEEINNFTQDFEKLESNSVRCKICNIKMSFASRLVWNIKQHINGTSHKAKKQVKSMSIKSFFQPVATLEPASE